MTGTTASTLGSLHESESEEALGSSASSSVCEYVGDIGALLSPTTVDAPTCSPCGILTCRVHLQ